MHDVDFSGWYDNISFHASHGRLAWMPDELSPAHNIVCSGSSVWHRSVEEKLCLVWKPTRPIKLSGRALYDDEQMIRPIKLSGRASYDAGQIPRAGLPGRAASGAPGPGGLPGRGGDARGTHGARGTNGATWLRGILTSGNSAFLVQ